MTEIVDSNKVRASRGPGRIIFIHDKTKTYWDKRASNLRNCKVDFIRRCRPGTFTGGKTFLLKDIRNSSYKEDWRFKQISDDDDSSIEELKGLGYNELFVSKTQPTDNMTKEYFVFRVSSPSTKLARWGHFQKAEPVPKIIRAAKENLKACSGTAAGLNKLESIQPQFKQLKHEFLSCGEHLFEVKHFSLTELNVVNDKNFDISGFIRGKNEEELRQVA